ncbi:hypothetical protein MCHI_002265 [Candidatus Magnetoovum chiemensis]|nr:hypothetical protein MCHI_002265 [Candidatus Magnetoovum chiemensis]
MEYSLKDIIYAVLKRYDGNMYNFALTKFIYLIDMFNAYRTGKQLTNIKWIKSQYGPFVWDIIDVVRGLRNLFYIEEIGDRERIYLNEDNLAIDKTISDLVDEIANNVPDPNRYPSSFRAYIYNTPQMSELSSGQEIDLERIMKAERFIDEIYIEYSNDADFDEALEYLANN